jgi:uncharacterized caspase-like protein
MKLIAVLLLLPLTADAAERIALVIGNGKYVNVDPLPNPTNDVSLVSEALKGVGFKVTLLVDADRRTMDRATKAFATELDEAGRNAVGVFYFAGHGVSYEGENWLLPVGAEITQGADIEYESMSANKVLKLMEGARNATDILILDACRNSPFRGFSLSGTRAVSSGMSRMDAPAGSFIAYSTAPGAVAYDGAGQYSPFAEAFAAEINTPGNSIGDMMIEVRKKVKASTAKLGARPQTPWDSSSLSGRFAFNPGQPQPAGVAATPQPVPAATAPQSNRAGETADARLWASIENSTDPAEFSVYLDRYPNGQYADLARIRRDRFSSQASAQPATSANSAPPASAAGAAAASADTDPEAAQLCRQFAAGDPEIFSECMDEYGNGGSGSFASQPGQPPAYDFPAGSMPQQGGQTTVWYDEEFNQWQVSINGASFTASAFLPGTGPVALRGESQGYAVSYGIFDANGQQIGYGQGSIDDASHISVTSYWSNGAFLGSGRFHVNHPPN